MLRNGKRIPSLICCFETRLVEFPSIWESKNYGLRKVIVITFVTVIDEFHRVHEGNHQFPDMETALNRFPLLMKAYKRKAFAHLNLEERACL